MTRRITEKKEEREATGGGAQGVIHPTDLPTYLRPLRFVELKEEVKQLRKRKAAPSRISRSEPQRRKIAQRQNWKCASTSCNLEGELEAYDLDHIIPLWKGGEDTDDNLQALCPACHRRKTDLERLEYETLNH